MTLKEALTELINENILIDFDEQNNSIEITESHNEDENYKKDNSKNDVLRSVKIVGIEEFIIAFKPDNKDFRFLGSLINDNVKHIKKSCDGIVFCKMNNQNYVLLVELKSTTHKYLQEKYKATKLLLTFLNETLKTYYEIEEKFIVVNVLFDRKPKRGKPKFLPLPIQRKENTQVYFHQGYLNAEGNESRIKRILDALNEEIRGNDDITYLNY